MNGSFSMKVYVATAPDFGMAYSTRRENMHSRGKKFLF
jgi:hypothetical protein